jgi:putative glycosyltransferase (TIGR04348 family)
VTALRWAALLRSLGHRVRLVDAWRGEACDLLVALHATKSHASVVRWRAERGAAPLVVACGGTDLYLDLPAGVPAAREALALASRILVLQPLAVEALPPELRGRARVVLQSARPPAGARRWAVGDAPVAIAVAHLRAVKDPFLAADAARLLPPSSRVRVVHLGAALDEAAERRAREEGAPDGRWRWAGERRRREALQALAAGWVAVVTSRAEGGPNAISEAIACGVPVIASRVDGNVGMLGSDYPGLFPPGDAHALADLLVACERDVARRAALVEACERLAPSFAPAREREAWHALVAEVVT